MEKINFYFILKLVNITYYRTKQNYWHNIYLYFYSIIFLIYVLNSKIVEIINLSVLMFMVN